MKKRNVVYQPCAFARQSSGGLWRYLAAQTNPLPPANTGKGKSSYRRQVCRLSRLARGGRGYALLLRKNRAGKAADWPQQQVQLWTTAMAVQYMDVCRSEATREQKENALALVLASPAAGDSIILNMPNSMTFDARLARAARTGGRWRLTTGVFAQ